MGGRYFITGVQLGVILGVTQLLELPGISNMARLLRDIEKRQYIGNMPKPYEDYEIAIVPRSPREILEGQDLR